MCDVLEGKMRVCVFLMYEGDEENYIGSVRDEV